MQIPGEYEWSVAIFAHNEALSLARCLSSVEVNAQGRKTHVTIILNGTRDHSLDVVQNGSWPNLDISVFRIATPDKSNAINQVIHGLRPRAKIYFFVDAYVKIHDHSMCQLERRLEEKPYAYVASSIPTNGRTRHVSQEHVLRGGMVTGQLYAARPSFLNRVRAENIFLPIGLYRGDGLISSWANNDLDGITHPWDVRRVEGVADATFEISVLSIFRLKDIVRQFRREIRQARGDMENAAIKVVIRQKGFGGLPRYADDLIRTWWSKKEALPGGLRKQFFRMLASRELRHSQLPSAEALEPHLIFRNFSSHQSRCDA